MLRLPIDDLLPTAIEALEAHGRLVLVAPPGAGKSTRLPPALLDARPGKVLLLQPRRVAARAVAARIAEERAGALGQEVGYQVRMERRVSAATRLEVITEGILTRRLQSDPFVEGVSCVVLDEFHERSVHLDLALALLKEVRIEARPDLWIVVMSATLEAGPVAAYLGDAPVLEVEGRPHAVKIEHALRKDDRPLAGRVCAAVERALASARRGILVFLPGAAEILRAREAIAARALDVELLELYGAMSLDAQRRVLQPATDARRRRVVLATNLAETSLTIAGVDAVVDSGLAKIARHDPGSGIDRLEISTISQASAAQRAGRAGRLGPGVALRLFSAAQYASMPQQTSAEIKRVDLAPTLLELRAWGADPRRFDYFERPTAGSIEAAEQLLQRLGALDRQRAITTRGHQLLELPLHPRLGATLLDAQAAGQPRRGAMLVALLSERDPLRREECADLVGRSDLLERIERLEEAEAEGFRRSACRRLALDERAAKRLARVRDELVARLSPSARGGVEGKDDEALLRSLLSAFGDRVARRRQRGSPRALMVGGRGLRLAAESVVREAELFLAHRVEGRGAEGIVLSASAIERGWLELSESAALHFDKEEERVIARAETRYLDLVLESRASTPDAEQAAALLLQAATPAPLDALRPGPEARALLARLAFLQRHMPELKLEGDAEALLRSLLPELCNKKSSFAELRRADIASSIEGSLTPTAREALRRHAPPKIELPSGRMLSIEYPEDGAVPILAVKLQELFGLAETPRLANGRVPLLLHLLAPNGRPAQVTRDLRSFWDSTYAEVRKELRQRYPKHPWPEDPWKAEPTHLTKRRR